ncbi:OmpA family protein [Microvirga tunisiensis]|uniref:OmpA family protein n=2 Tax=Pannonibacter tanglangensis TaxID=2750084 RepID=A0A7X5F3E1_9HYPH|nr:MULTISPECIES: flagellar motor protein MotB [unclassified Pannonibacter]NBN64521.1 OmpA family protein [Pannonibacter sp. XCT-34]NBN79055.1 OmpA family protein [Pannonibacter sp. XCT-53]
MARKKKHAHGGHGWFVTFADLMGLLMSFFVVVAAFSSQDKAKLMAVVGSMQEAFGSSKDSRMAGMVEIDGLPVRTNLHDVEIRRPDETPPAQAQTNTAETQDKGEGNSQFGLPTSQIQQNGGEQDTRRFASAAATLRQALQSMPDIAEVSKHVMMEESEEGLHIRIVDQDGRAMFAEGSVQPSETIRMLLKRLAPVIGQMPNQVTISGHTSRAWNAMQATENWRLSVNRAIVVKELLEEGGVATDQFMSVTGKSDTEPLFINDPFLSGNRRVEILLMHSAPVLPN